ncbi:MAG: glycosyltransferase family 2 protein [Faecousia sp.]
MPKVSVIVPVYKAEAYLRSCVDSILSQTFSDLEVFLVDDGSPDACPAICDEYAGQDSRVRVIHQDNQGQAAARNHALAQATGEWVCFVDSDDMIHPQTVELLYHAAMDSGAKISMCPMLEAAELPSDFFLSRDRSCEAVEMDEAMLVQLFDREEYPSWVACAKLIRREIVDTHLFCPGRVYEDNEAVCHWVCAAKTVARVPYELYFYRTNPNSTTQYGYSPKRMDYLWALEQIIRFYTEIRYFQLRQRFCDLYAEAAAGFYFRAVSDWDRPDIAKQIKAAVRNLFGKDRIPLTKSQFELLLDAMHPKLIRLYWPLEGAVRTLRDKGPGEMLRKIAQQLGKGDGT